MNEDKSSIESSLLKDIGARLKASREKAGYSKLSFSKAMGISDAQYGRYEKGDSPISSLQLAIMMSFIRSKIPGYNIEWLLTGLGDMKSGNPAHEENILIPQYEIKASAGPGVLIPFHEDELGGTYAFKKSWLKQRGLSSEKLAIIKVAGDSMEPRLFDADLVLINTASVSPCSGKAYVIRLRDELLVKYVQWINSDTLQISSENTRYPPITLTQIDLDEEEVAIIGQVVCSSHEW